MAQRHAHSQPMETYGHTIAGRRSFVTPGRFFCPSSCSLITTVMHIRSYKTQLSCDAELIDFAELIILNLINNVAEV